jgi:hypothetical protein
VLSKCCQLEWNGSSWLQQHRTPGRAVALAHASAACMLASYAYQKLLCATQQPAEQ